MTLRDESTIAPVARSLTKGWELRPAENGVFIKPTQLDNDDEFYMSIEELGDALRLVGWNRVDLFPEG